jgi:hypothetical protein
MEGLNETSAARTGGHARAAAKQRAPHGAHRVEGRVTEEGSSVEACQRKEAGEETVMNLLQ